VAAVQYTFTHKQYTERHSETEYTEQKYIIIIIIIIIIHEHNNIKGKVIPLQARCGPEGGWMYNSTLP